MLANGWTPTPPKRQPNESGTCQLVVSKFEFMNVRRRVSIVAGVMLAATVGGVTAQQVPKQGVAKPKGSLNTAKAEQPKKHQEAVAAPLANQPSIALPDDKTKKNSEEIETQRKLVEFTKWLAVVGALQFLALIVQAVVFWRTLRQMRDTAKRELRAYVCISEARVKFYSPADPEALVHVKNCGKTPAYKVGYKIHLWIGQYPLPSGTELPPPSEVVMSATAVMGSDRGLTLTHRKLSTVVIPALPLGSA